MTGLPTTDIPTAGAATVPDHPDSNPGSGTKAGTAVLERVQDLISADTPWQVLLHNDPVNLATYVTGVLTAVLKCSRETAERYMLLAHTEGRTAVADGTLEHCETIANQLMGHTLWATLDKAGS
jgi:ATP-dependent Clp protease adaptor protein ClpS